MTRREFEQKCALLANQPQVRWFDLRFKAFLTMMNNAEVDMLDLSHIFPTAKMQNVAGFVFKIEDAYYFLVTLKQGIVYEFFNVETIEFGTLNNVLATKILLSSDDSQDRFTVIPLLMHLNGFKTRSELKERIDSLFNIAIHSNMNHTFHL